MHSNPFADTAVVVVLIVKPTAEVVLVIIIIRLSQEDSIAILDQL